LSNRMVKSSKKRKNKSAILDGAENVKEEPKKVKVEKEVKVEPVPTAKNIVGEMIDEQEESEVEDEIDNVIDNDEAEIQGTEDAEIIDDIPLATEEANPEDYPAEEINDEEDGAEEMNTESEKPEKDVKSAEDRTIFVKNLPFDATVEHIKTLFVNATDVRILTKNNGSSRGKAFVEMKDVASAEKAAKFKSWVFNGRNLNVDLCGTKSSTFDERQNLESSTLSIRGQAEFDLADLEDAFPNAAQIRLPKSMENFAYVQFESVEAAKEIKEQTIEINGVPIISKFVPDRESKPRARKKGDKWEKKKQAKRDEVIKEKEERKKKHQEVMNKDEVHQIEVLKEDEVGIVVEAVEEEDVVEMVLDKSLLLLINFCTIIVVCSRS